MRNKKTAAVAGAAFAGLISQVHFASATLINSVSLDQSVTETYGSPAGVSPVAHTQAATGSTVPFYQQLVGTTPYGGNVTATYNISNSASLATFFLDVSYSLTASDNGLSEQSVSTSFNFSQPVNYTAVVSESGPGAVHMLFDTVNSPQISGTTVTYTGTILPQTLAFAEYGGNQNTSVPGTVQSTTDSIHITFTPVPEPASIGLIGTAAGVFLLRRRGRKALTIP